MEPIYRASLAQIRLLRVAAHFRATGEVLDLNDPCGARLNVERKEGSIKVWSVGTESRSHGGQGKFAFQVFGTGSQDIVLEVSR